MRNSKTKKRLFTLLSLVLMLLVVEGALGYALENVSFSTFFNRDMDEIESQGGKADMVFIGASRVYHVYPPALFEEKLGMDCVINAGSSGQSIAGSYYMLKELLQRFDPSYVVLGTTVDQLFSTTDETQADLIVMDRLSPKNAFDLALHEFNAQGWLNALLKSYRFRNYLTPGAILKNLREKRAIAAGDNALFQADDGYYADTGFVVWRSALADGNVAIDGRTRFAEDEIDEKKLDYLNKIVELCQDKGKKLFLVTGPTSMMRIYNIENYQGAVDFYARFAEEHGLRYHNLNYLRGREQFLPDSKMLDFNHTNCEGAYWASELYAEVLQKELAGEDASEYFYPDLDALKADVRRVVAVGADIRTDGGTARVAMTSLHNADAVPEYQVLLSADGENYTVAADWSPDDRCTVDVSGLAGYTIMVRARLGIPGETEAYQCYTF